MIDPDEFLAHYGIKGQKWGVRKRRNESARAKIFGNKGKPSTKGFSKDAKVATNIRQKAKSNPVKVKALSNQEIQTFLTRVNLESRFVEATPGPGARAMKAVKSILGIQSTVSQAANSPAAQAVKTGLDKKMKKKT